MSMFVGGYFLTFDTIRALLNKLEIDDRGVPEWRLEMPINNWLAEQGIVSMLAVAIVHPVAGKPDKVHGIFFMLQFLETSRLKRSRVKPELNPVLHRNDRDICVKKLAAERWMFLEDIFNLTTKIEEFLETAAQAGRLVGSQ